MQGFVAATVRGYTDLLADPAAGLAALLDANPAIDRRFARASLNAYLPLFAVAGRPFGAIDPNAVERLSKFMLDAGLAAEPIAPRRFATPRFTGGGDG